MLERDPGAPVASTQDERIGQDEIDVGVREAIIELLERNDREVPVIEDRQGLMATGLTSLDLAAVIALLESRWKVDPFLEHVPITEVRTVGELCRAYALCLAGEIPEEDERDLDRARDRVQDRMRAGVRDRARGHSGEGGG